MKVKIPKDSCEECHFLDSDEFCCLFSEYVIEGKSTQCEQKEQVTIEYEQKGIL